LLRNLPLHRLPLHRLTVRMPGPSSVHRTLSNARPMGRGQLL